MRVATAPAMAYNRPDVLAAVHPEGEVVSTTEAEQGYVVVARLSDASTGRLAEFVTGARAPAPARARS